MTATKGNSPRPRAVGPWLARKSHDAGRESTTMDWIRPWLCKHVNRRCLPYVLSPRPAALSRAVLCRPQGADGGASEACKPQRASDRERGSHNRARVHASPLVAWRGVGGVGTYSVSDPLPLRKQSYRARERAIKPYTATSPTGRRTRKLCDKTHEQTIHDAVCSGALPPRWTFTTRSCLRPRVSTRSRVRRMGATGESAG